MGAMAPTPPVPTWSVIDCKVINFSPIYQIKNKFNPNHFHQILTMIIKEPLCTLEKQMKNQKKSSRRY